MPQPPVGQWADLYAELADPKHPACSVGPLDPRRLQRARAGYYGLITHIDHQLNRFFESLAEFGQAQNTYACFISDHGEMLGDHHIFRKSVPFQGSIRVPFVLSGPRDSGIQPGKRLSDPVVELCDVMPTLLNCAGLEVPSHLHGRSLLPLARGEKAPWRPYLHGEHTQGKFSNHWIHTGHAKYVWLSQTGRELLFDLDHDPQELHDLAAQPKHSAALAQMRQWLIDDLAGREEDFTDGRRLIPGRPVKPVLSHPLPPA